MNATTAPGEVAERCIFINFDISSYYFNDNLTLKIVFVNHLIFCVINAVMSASTICLNSITAITYWKSIHLKKKMANFLIMLLSLKGNFDKKAFLLPKWIKFMAVPRIHRLVFHDIDRVEF